MDLSKLTASEKAELKKQLDADAAAEQARKDSERQTYKDLVDSTVLNAAELLQGLSSTMLRVKQQVFEDFATLIASKNELFNVKSGRQSDTFTSSDGKVRITLGNRMNEGWDDTAEVGIEKVKEYLSTLAKDEDSTALVNAVMRLLAKDSKGTLKASKVLELEKLSQDTGDADFCDAIRIIKDSYRPVPTCQFIQLEARGAKDEMIKVPLSLAAM